MANWQQHWIHKMASYWSGSTTKASPWTDTMNHRTKRRPELLTIPKWALNGANPQLEGQLELRRQKIWPQARKCLAPEVLDRAKSCNRWRSMITNKRDCHGLLALSCTPSNIGDCNKQEKSYVGSYPLRALWIMAAAHGHNIIIINITLHYKGVTNVTVWYT